MKPRFNEGEIAITTHTKFRENQGKVVRLNEYLGRQRWNGLEEPQHVWLVECLCEESYLYYLYERQRELSRAYVGQMPEYFLRRISIESGQGVLDLHAISDTVSNSDVSV
jgi:hypothetical protein